MRENKCMEQKHKIAETKKVQESASVHCCRSAKEPGENFLLIRFFFSEQTVYTNVIIIRLHVKHH